MTDTAGHRPLVAFTSLAIAGAGLVAACALAHVLHGRAPAGPFAAGVILLAAGLVVSFGHLGQRRRAALAVRGAGRSALSNEVILAGTACGLAMLAGGLAWAGAPSGAVVIAAGLVNALFLISVGLVYRLEGQLTWQGFSALTPLTGGLTFGAIVLGSSAGADGAMRWVLLLPAIDALVFSQRWHGIATIPYSAPMLDSAWHRRRSQVLAGRFFLLDVVPFFMLAVAPGPLAIVAAAAGLALDRIGFYALAVQRTTEHEVAAVESRIEAMSERTGE
jgi:DMSO reductase anchor subunit